MDLEETVDHTVAMSIVIETDPSISQCGQIDNRLVQKRDSSGNHQGSHGRGASPSPRGRNRTTWVMLQHNVGVGKYEPSGTAPMVGVTS